MKTLLTNSAAKAAAFIKKGGVVGFPTETVYGLGANIYDEKAVRKIFKAKGRPADNPLIVHVAAKRDIAFLVEEITPAAKRIIAEFFPGPVTVILKKNEVISDFVTAGLDTIAIRMPSSKIAREFIKSCGLPIAAPSANLSGSPSPTSFVHVMHDFSGKIPCVLIGPDAKHGLESTVIDCTGNIPRVLRPGVITIEQLRKKIDKRITFKRNSKVHKSPGTKYKHYAPKAKVKIVSNFKFQMSNVNEIQAYIGINRNTKYPNAIVCKDNAEYGKKLFSFFRECDSRGIKTIYCQRVAEKGIGLAIMNRLKKAAK